jgi:hypothetical protein
MAQIDSRTEASLVNEVRELAAEGDGCAIGRLLEDVDVLQRFEILRNTYTKPGEEVGPDRVRIRPSQGHSVTWGNEESITLSREQPGQWFASKDVIYQESLNFSTYKHDITCK